MFVFFRDGGEWFSGAAFLVFFRHTPFFSIMMVK